MELTVESASQVLSLIVAVTSGSYAAVQAGVSWRERAREAVRTRSERRMAELRALTKKLDEVLPTLASIFDYKSERDHHLRLVDLTFQPREVETRSAVDRAFEHFREVHRAVTLDLVDRDDLGVWIYWVHCVRSRPVLRDYSRACGYDAFMVPLADWTRPSAELALLEAHCPWWFARRLDAADPPR